MRISDWSSDVCSSDLQLKALRGQSSAASTMAAGFARKLSAAGLSQRYAASAATILAQMVMPALDSQIAHLANLLPPATHYARFFPLPHTDPFSSAIPSLQPPPYPPTSSPHNLFP